MDDNWFDEPRSRLTSRCPLPFAAPFTAAMASDLGVSRQNLRTLVSLGFVRRVLREVYAISQAPDDMWMRTRALSLVLPQEAVVTDRTAAWLHGVDILPRGSRLGVPPVHAFHTTDTRMERDGIASGRRGLASSDITVIHGVRVTTALRTALDLGRLLWRFDALAAIDGFLRIGVPHDLLSAEMGRFRGYRGVRQLRALVPLGDPRAESPGESALRLHWYDAGLPRPELQVWVCDHDGTLLYRLDIALLQPLYAVEYDGEDHHSSDEDKEHDLERREWCSRERGWYFEVFTKIDVYDRKPDPLPRLAGGLIEARRNTLWTPYGGEHPATRKPLWAP
jgi:hypothetical protein